ncbi:MAG: HNH endonuclease [Pseudomonadota bacterium]
MKERKFYDVTPDKAHMQKEKTNAAELKKSSWWKQKLVEGVCHYCGQKFPKEKLTMDHIVPVARGGKSSKGNVVVCCFNCNQSKGLNTPVDILLDKIRKDKEGV